MVIFQHKGVSKLERLQFIRSLTEEELLLYHNNNCIQYNSTIPPTSTPTTTTTTEYYTTKPRIKMSNVRISLQKKSV